MTKVEVLICIVLYALSTAATWIWAPSLFIAAEVAYNVLAVGAVRIINYKLN